MSTKPRGAGAVTRVSDGGGAVFRVRLFQVLDLRRLSEHDFDLAFVGAPVGQRVKHGPTALWKEIPRKFSPSMGAVSAQQSP